MTWAALQEICRLLSGRQRPPSLETTWEDVIATAGEHMITPALMAPVAACDQAPEPVVEYFAAVNALNRDRNSTVLDALFATTSILCNAGFEPVLLKGAASLVTGLYPDMGDRIVGDLDLLLPAAQVEGAVQCLRDAGFTSIPETIRRWVRPRSHHAPVLFEPATSIGVELHRNLGGGTRAGVIQPEAMLADAEPLHWRGLRLKVPSPTHRVLHNISHDQLHHRGFDEGSIDLRQLRELSLLNAQHSNQIDWPEIEQVFARHGLIKILQKQASLCDVLLDQQFPIAVSDPTRHLKALERGRVGPKAGRLQSLIGIYWRGVRDDPRLAVNLLDPRAWPERLKGIRSWLAQRDKQS